MSKRQQASRRRSYGRRQHEIHERPLGVAGLRTEGRRTGHQTRAGVAPLWARLAAEQPTSDAVAGRAG